MDARRNSGFVMTARVSIKVVRGGFARVISIVIHLFERIHALRFFKTSFAGTKTFRSKQMHNKSMDVRAKQLLCKILFR